MKNNKILLTIFFCCIFLFIYAIIPQNQNVHLSYDYPTATNLNEMIEASEYIVLGHYTGFEKSWNMARNPNNISEEDSTNYVEGNLYNFSITEVLKGDISETNILVNHRYLEAVNIDKSNITVSKDGTLIKSAKKNIDADFMIQDPLYIEPSINDTYILFLLKDTNFQNYYGAVEPFSIKIVNEKAELQTNLKTNNTHTEETVTYGLNNSITVSITSPYIEDTITGMSYKNIKKEIMQ